MAPRSTTVLWPIYRAFLAAPGNCLIASAASTCFWVVSSLCTPQNFPVLSPVPSGCNHSSHNSQWFPAPNPICICTHVCVYICKYLVMREGNTVYKFSLWQVKEKQKRQSFHQMLKVMNLMFRKILNGTFWLKKRGGAGVKPPRMIYRRWRPKCSAALCNEIEGMWTFLGGSLVGRWWGIPGPMTEVRNLGMSSWIQ